MKAIVFEEYGKADVLKSVVLADPLPGPSEVRIRIRAAGVNPVDIKIRKGLVAQRIPHVFPVIPGWDAAGVVDLVGPECKLFKPGDNVYAYCRKPVVQFGTYAQYIVLPEQQVAPMPVSMNYQEAATIPLAALTAWQSLFDSGGLQKDQTVLIHAGAGGVGGFAIQLAKNAGAYVITTASQHNHSYVSALGADEVIDYTAIDFRDAVLSGHPKGVDITFDTVGGDVQKRSVDVVRKGGVLVSILAFAEQDKIEKAGIYPRYVFVAPNRDQLIKLSAFIDGGKFKTKLAHVLPLAQASKAHELIETGHTSGKIVLEID